MYFITAFEKAEWDVGSSRCFGYFNTFEEADKAAKENWCDMHECLYCYIIIEKIEPGIHSICVGEDRWFYKYNFDTQGFEPMEEPEALQSTCNFAIG